jgi:hypothetical protein
MRVVKLRRWYAAARRAVVSWLERTPAHLGVAAACAVCALIAIGMAMVTDQTPHRVWGLLAAAGYLVAGVASLRTRRPIVGVRVAAAGSVLLPTVVLVLAGLSQPEVGVVERSARLLVDTGSPYLATPTTTYDVNPYLPAMSLFGLPRLVFPNNGLGDPRWWFLAVFCICFVAADRLTRRARGTEPVLWALLACPFLALHASVGGHDLPVVGLLCLSIALASRGRTSQAGLALGLACALKASAWPAAAVIGALVVARWGWKHGGRFAANATAVVVGVSLPVLLGPTAGAMFDQAAGFPMANSTFASPADSPTPGVLLSHGGPTAKLIGYALMLVVVLALLVALAWRPPRTLTQAAGFLALALTAAMLVLPTSRAGYLLYPVVLVVLGLRGRQRVATRSAPLWSSGNTELLVPAISGGEVQLRTRFRR